ncbi:MAG: lytic transglycosylase domain-containing protein [Deltaproteobacteria bacterium]|nr:lytic transglycosylase domain-containing protein [Deltaproteobacteria bacterium]
MLLGKFKRLGFGKTLMAFSVAFIAEAFVYPSVRDAELWYARPEKTLTYVRDVLKESRTGLGSLEELKLADVIFFESVSHKMDPLFVLALIKTESTFYNWSRSMNGAVGLMQIKPATGEELAEELDLKWKGEETLLNPYLNVKMGVHYFSNLMERYDDDAEVTLAAYNVGPGIVTSRHKLNEGWGQEFVGRVLGNYKDLKERAEYY